MGLTKGQYGSIRGNCGRVKIRGRRRGKPESIHATTWKVVSIKRSGLPLVPSEMQFFALCAKMTPDESARLGRMEYAEFLRTEYWKILSTFIRFARHYTCQACNKRSGKKETFHCHHKTYARRGQEYLSWQSDILLLCPSCHKRQHYSMIKPG